MISFRNTYYEIIDSHSHTLKFLNSSISFIDISNVKKRLEKKGEYAYNNYLTEWEHSYIEDIKIPKRRMDFISGRMAGKRAVKRHMIKNNGNSIANSLRFNDIEIKRTVSGRPLVFIKDGSSRNGSSDFQISISHTSGVAASLVCNKNDCRGLGIDIEKIENRDNSILDVAFTDDEIIKLKEYNSGNNGSGNLKFDENISRSWSIKEAVLKSLGVGVNIDLKDIEIVDIGSDETRVLLRNGARERYELLEGEDIQVESAKIEKFMVSIACLC